MQNLLRQHGIIITPNLDNLPLVIPSRQPRIVILIRLSIHRLGPALEFNARPPTSLTLLVINNDARDDEFDGPRKAVADGRDGVFVRFDGVRRAGEGVRAAGEGEDEVGVCDVAHVAGWNVRAGEGGEGGGDVGFGEFEGGWLGW